MRWGRWLLSLLAVVLLSAPAQASITSLDDPFTGDAGALMDPNLWNTRDEDSGAGVVDFGGDAQAGTNGRGVIELDGLGNVSLEGDFFWFPAWGELGFVSTESVLRPAPGADPLYLYFWNARSDQYRSKVFLGFTPRDNSVALGVVREGYGWSIQGGQIEVAIQDTEYQGSWLYIPEDQFFPVNPVEDEGGPNPYDNVAHDFRLILSATETRLQYKDIYSSTWLEPDWSLFGGPPASNAVNEMWIVVGGRVGDPAEIDHTDFLIDRIQLTTTDFACPDGNCPPRTPPWLDDFDGPAASPVDPALWNTRDADSGAGVVDVGGDAVAGTDGRGTVQLDGNGQVLIEGDQMAPPEFGQLGMVSTTPVRRPAAGENPMHVYFWNARADQYRSKIILGLSYRPDSVSLGEIRQGYGWSILGGGIQVAIEDTEYDGADLGIADTFYPVDPAENEGGPDPANNVAHDFRITLTDSATTFEYKPVSSRTWIAPDWSGLGGPPPSAAVHTMWIALGAKVGLPDDIDHTDFLVDRIQVTEDDLDCQGPFCRFDGNGDGVIDFDDYMIFESCLTGPDLGPVTGTCVTMDGDDDTDVDLADFARFQFAFRP